MNAKVPLGEKFLDPYTFAWVFNATHLNGWWYGRDSAFVVFHVL